ncbi:curved DNA-binding protein CbpA/uncharacterized protein [Paraburkholderia youngii]|uniref:DnaJ domain-containing protein n=1 Tax=Paraburkholderia youngii TaxID=2782701 RepID=UPI003D23765D
MHTHYDNLKVARNAPHAVIKAAYKALSQRYHPDKNDHPDATRIMKILNDAWAVLGDADARAAYDRQLAAEEARAQSTTQEPQQQADPPPQSARYAREPTQSDYAPPPAAGSQANLGTVMNWYGGMNRGQRIFMFVVASIAALFGLGGEGMALLLILPLLLLIYLQLGAPKNAKANEERTRSDTRASKDPGRGTWSDSEPEAPASASNPQPDNLRPSPDPHRSSIFPESIIWLFFGGLLLAALVALGVTLNDASRPNTRQSVAPAFVAATASSVDGPAVRSQPAATSFDCNKAHWPSEVLICGDDDLAAMDRELASTFAQAKAVTSDKKSFGEIARRNWNWRNKNCTDKACLVAWYRDEQRWLLGVLNSANAPDATTSTLSAVNAAAAVATATSAAVNAAPAVATATSDAVNVSSAVATALPQELLQPTSEGNEVTCVTYRGEISCK